MERVGHEIMMHHVVLAHNASWTTNSVVNDGVALVDAILAQAITQHASDVHIEPLQQGVRVRFRVDGMLHDQDIVDCIDERLLISRLKVLARLDIAQHLVPQDGKFRIAVHDVALGSSPKHIIDVRVAIFPCLYGEKAVVRILDRSIALYQLESLGFNERIIAQFYAMLALQHSFILVTGPTGSGKTTTLYAALSYLNDATRNIVTMEDPIEYDIAGITQSQVNTKIDFNFVNGLRAMLRQDPDVIMVGEIRDIATARMALQAALTGHVVLSTLHTTNALGAIARLVDMGIEPYLINAALSGVLAQRLARRLCGQCKVPFVGDVTLFGLDPAMCSNVYQAVGCMHCRGTGYRGRIAISELLVVTDELRAGIASGVSGVELARIAAVAGFVPLQCDAMRKVAAGFISPHEYVRNQIE